MATFLLHALHHAADMQGLTWGQALKRDELIFRLSDGTQTKALDKAFERLLRDADLSLCPQTEQNRTLYSLRHSYITWQLDKNELPLTAIAKQRRTSVQMIEKHYYWHDAWKNPRSADRLAARP